jgi:ribosomal protein S18 acetylase RimI-like enzyme
VIRNYRDSDYEQLKELYQHSEWYGGVFDEARDGRERLAKKITDDPEAIMVYEDNGELLGTISIIEDGRVAWLYRFIVKDFDLTITKELYDRAVAVLKQRGHTQVLVYSAVKDEQLDGRYQSLGMEHGTNYTCYWQEI